jgi:hypothetical protein
MIYPTSHPCDIYNHAETLIVSSGLKRSGSDKSDMTALFNVLAPVQWLRGEEWEQRKIIMLPKLAWLAGKSRKNTSYYFLRDFYQRHQDTYCHLSQEQYLLFCESLKANYYFYCPVGANAVSR